MWARVGIEVAVISKRLPDGGESPGVHVSHQLTASETTQMEGAFSLWRMAFMQFAEYLLESNTP